MPASLLSSPHLNPNILGQSPFPGPQCVVGAPREAAAEKDSLPVRGLRSLREMVTEFLHRRHGIGRARRHQVLVISDEIYSDLDHSGRAFAGGPEIDACLGHCRAVLAALGQRSAATLRDAGCRVPTVGGAFLRRHCPQTLEAIDRIAGCVAN